jgi:hypothetical protein
MAGIELGRIDSRPGIAHRASAVGFLDALPGWPSSCANNANLEFRVMAATTKVQKPTALGTRASFGFGDRLGLATEGHAVALRRCGGSILPIFAQQSIREMTRTNRTPTGVMGDAMNALAIVGYTGEHGADADHLKTPADIERTAAAGFVFFTIDPSGEVDAQADDYTPQQIEEKFKLVAGVAPWVAQYQGKKISLGAAGTIDLTEAACKRAAVKYGKAIQLAISLSKHIAKTATGLKQPFEIELSVDETPQPTTTAEHYIIADQCLKSGMKLVSLAPRFVGDFEKGVDFKGSKAAFEKSLAEHAAVAKLLGPYKLSLHSGSDKLTVYKSLAKITNGVFHVKTAGTSYLEALRVVAQTDGDLFRRLIDFSRGRYNTDRATYHVSATLDSAPPASDVKDVRKLEKMYLGLWSDVPAGAGLTDPGRQILHCTFGSVLTDATFGPLFRQVVTENKALYTKILDEHFGRHLDALRSGM